ncbi:GerAB/ArcD/ProY family transporter [Alkalihalobacterium alkalinitrilicum]|uniref:GerAB/ArcD/ProY family transporter n=1 Tax=Alkalihalobacterium alkalinitrilicum TaxID=427920 RepID=UPI00099522C3|nr:endospore germination permease [Alkalihalobacterium alkalinitrilicum]
MEYQKKITVIQTAIITASTTIGVGILALPRITVEAVDTGAPLVTLLGSLIAFLGVYLITILAKRFPGKSIIQYSEEVIGKWLSRFFNIIIICFFATLSSLVAREFGEVIVTSVLRETPLEVTVIVMLLLASLSTRSNITTFAYIHHFYFPLILAPALVIVAFSLKNANLLYLQPIIGNYPNGLIKGMLTVAALFQGSFILTFIIPAMREIRKALKASIWGMLITGGLFFIIVIANVSVFGAQEIKNLIWPTLELAKMTSLPGQVLERLDAGFLAVWVTAVFTTLFSSYFLTIYALKELFHFWDHKLFSFIMLPFIFIIAMQPQNILELYNVIELVGRLGLLLTIGYPSLLLIIAVISKTKGNENAGRNLDQNG